MISFFFSHIQQTVGAAFGENIILKIPLVQVMYKSKGRNEIALSYSIPTYQYIYGKQLYSLFLYRFVSFNRYFLYHQNFVYILKQQYKSSFFA